MMNTGNLIFYLLMILGPVVASSSSSWLMCWVGMELSFLGMVPLMIGTKEKSASMGKEAGMKYFCFQALGSGVVLLGGILLFMSPVDYDMQARFIFVFGLMIKLGMFPIHFWVPSVVASLDRVPLLLVLTWQKIAPFMFLINLVENSVWMEDLLLILGGFSALVGAVIGLNQTKISPMLGASSIAHTGWVVVSAVYGLFWLYFICYFITLAFALWFFSVQNKLLSSFMILGLSGLPPFLMFVPKLGVMKMLLLTHSDWWASVLPLLGSILSLFFYLKFFYSLYLESKLNNKFKMTSLFIMFSSILTLGIVILLFF